MFGGKVQYSGIKGANVIYIQRRSLKHRQWETTGFNVHAFPEYCKNYRKITSAPLQSTVLRHASSHHKRHGAILMFRFVGSDVKQQKCPTCNTSNAVNFV